MNETKNEHAIYTPAEIEGFYIALVLPALKELENELNDRIKVFQDKYKCTVFPVMPSFEQVRSGAHNLVLEQNHISALAYNVMTELMGLNPQDYPAQLYS